MESWIKQELEKTDLGDKRRTKRLMKIVSNLSTNPTSSVPMASETWAETKATYDFWDSPYLKPSMLLEGHIVSTVERIVKESVVLARKDTTELNYNSHKAVSGLGYLDNKYSRGLKVHSTLSVSTKGVPLGIIGQEVWARNPELLEKGQKRRQKATEEKESNKWIKGLKTTERIIPQEIQVVTITDREGDCYDLFASPGGSRSHLLIRATQDRCLAETSGRLWSTVESEPNTVTMTVEVKRNPTRPARKARCRDSTYHSKDSTTEKSPSPRPTDAN